MSAVLVSAIVGLLPEAVPELAVKIPVDVLLFFFNYLLQKKLSTDVKPAAGRHAHCAVPAVFSSRKHGRLYL